METKLTPPGQIIKGFKATDKDMCCRGFKYELGKWYEHEGELKMCSSGFHFCEYPSGPWAYYSNGRLFEVEAERVLLSSGPGADIKHVCKKIRLIKEIEFFGDGNTGHRNTGDGNTGHWNTGHWNTGDGNTGHRNTGDGNTGHENTGYWNTGNWNTGDRNTGYGNTGYGNTGHGNTGNHHSGCFNFGDANFYIFNKIADRSAVDFNLVRKLSQLLMGDEPIDPTPFLSLPNASEDAIKKLHEEHIKARKELIG